MREMNEVKTTPLPKPYKTEKLVNDSGELEYENFYTEGALRLYADIKAKQALSDLEVAIKRKDSLLRQALEALEHVKCWDNGKPAWEHLYSAIDAIQQELSK